ncbi:piggyBac transposable element-derived protein 4 [Trichonephila clavipes]|nr:piggyBac transposable element-derived protein 4 [Trichonephila clavipes]
MNRSNRRLDQLTFCIALARQLIDGYSSRKRNGHPASFQVKCVVPDDVSLESVRNHMPKMVSNYRRSSRKGQEKRTRNMFSECDVPLGIATGF